MRSAESTSPTLFFKEKLNNYEYFSWIRCRRRFLCHERRS
nr:MAG TPA: hypothetical protein [Microviridae sp.]